MTHHVHVDNVQVVQWCLTNIRTCKDNCKIKFCPLVRFYDLVNYEIHMLCINVCCVKFNFVSPYLEDVSGNDFGWKA